MKKGNNATVNFKIAIAITITSLNKSMSLSLSSSDSDSGRDRHFATLGFLRQFLLLSKPRKPEMTDAGW